MNHNIFDYCYHTNLSVSECIRRINNLPWEYECDLGTPLWYKCENISQNSILITFTGGQFRKIKKTQYILEFATKNTFTVVSARFNHELFGMSPMTLVTDIDLFMKQRIDAIRVLGD